MKRLPQTISREEFERLLGEPSRTAPTGVRNAAMLAAMFYCGLRVSEVRDLAPRDVIRTGSNAPSLRVRRGKGGRDRANLGVPRVAWALLERWAAVRPTSRYLFSTLDGNRLNDRYVRAMVARYSTRAGVFKLDADNRERPINPHVLRHSYATALIEGEVPIHDVQAALGHASLSTTQVYLHVNRAKLASTLRDAFDRDEGGSDLERMVAAMVEKRLDEIANGGMRHAA